MSDSRARRRTGASTDVNNTPAAGGHCLSQHRQESYPADCLILLTQNAVQSPQQTPQIVVSCLAQQEWTGARNPFGTPFRLDPSQIPKVDEEDKKDREDEEEP